MATVTLALGVTNPTSGYSVTSLDSGSGDGPYVCNITASTDLSAIEVGDILTVSAVEYRITAVDDGADQITVMTKPSVGAGPALSTAATDRADTDMTGLDALCVAWCVSGDDLIFEQHSEGGTMSTAPGTYTTDTLTETGSLVYRAASGESPVVSLTANGSIFDLDVTPDSDSPLTAAIGSGIEFIGGTTFTNSTQGIRISEDGGRPVTIDSAIVHGFDHGTAGLTIGIVVLSAANGNNLITNCLVYDIKTTATFALGLRIQAVNTDCYHNTVYDCTHSCLYHDATSSAGIYKNNIGMISGTADFNEVQPFAVFLNNCDEDATGVAAETGGGSTCITQTVANTFNAAGSDNFTQKVGSATINGGVDVSVTDDIDGRTRDASPDMGCYEHLGIPVFMHHYTKAIKAG